MTERLSLRLRRECFESDDRAQIGSPPSRLSDRRGALERTGLRKAGDHVSSDRDHS